MAARTKRRRVTCRPLSSLKLCSLAALVPRFALERRHTPEELYEDGI